MCWQPHFLGGEQTSSKKPPIVDRLNANVWEKIIGVSAIFFITNTVPVPDIFVRKKWGRSFVVEPREIFCTCVNQQALTGCVILTDKRD